MDPLYITHYNALRERFVSLLNSYAAPEPGALLEALDGFFAYRLLLHRNPDPKIELSELLSTNKSLRDFLTGFLQSSEFARTGGLMPPNKVLMTEVEGMRFWFNTSDREMGVLMAMGAYEPTTVSLIRRLVKPGMHCLDLGAQSGFYTCLMAQCVGPAGMVYSFEPMSANYELLTLNVRENRFEPRVTGYPLGASSKASTIQVSALSNMIVVGDVEGVPKVNIETVRIDDVIHAPIDFIKMDIEGHEPVAIEGMRAVIARTQPIIITEANEYWLRNCSATSGSAYIDSLIALGYDVYHEENLHQPLARGSVNLQILDSINLVAVPAGSKVLTA